ncbi:DDE-domain-containing protein [Lentithecium fluviatile CBS 122367]|uniref:DDE-domain-containing protein n=1 Tax=Lentithecium fluviatile CBS 122367 TaxID=1168545 RepID=A0A6G1JBB0_9PLEO|nr:DDE-domain-containing protein [Lentithecium fluviatile CBS 122367]
MDGHSSHVDVDFHWAARLAKIELVFMPPHSSHVLQPLDVSVFSVVKSKYRNQIRDLASLDDAAPVKKERFISYYHAAREDGMNERVIRAGWKGTGLVPYCPGRVVESSQQSIQKLEGLSRRTRTVLQKAGKAIGNANSRIAVQQEQISRLEYQVQSTGSQRKRKRITIDQNQRFADVERIKAMIDQAAAETAKKATPRALMAPETVYISPTTTTFESLCTQWQL